ncbi:MAG: TonB-dependent receptor [Bacteroidales bacterium]
MKRINFIIVLLLITEILTAQVEIEGVVVTATRDESIIGQIPGTVELISKKEIDKVPANNVDDLLRSVPSLSVDRASGIFSKNASITMRGLNGSYRALILVDGVPINKADGGSINWSRLNISNVERIEIMEGPASSLYGGNAMAGIINIITHKPLLPFEFSVKAFAGSFNTRGASLYAGGAKSPEKGFYWTLSSFYRKGDGYNIAPEAVRDTTDVNLFVDEFNVGTRLGYRFNTKNFIEAEVSFYDDKRGDGKKIYKGGYYKYSTDNARIKYQGEKGKYHFRADLFYQKEHYFYRKESLKKDKLPPYGILGYSWYDTKSAKQDYGFWMSASRKLFTKGEVQAGIDLKSGNVDGSDYYYTSTDVVTNKGKMDIAAVFLQYKVRLHKDRLFLTTGLRYDLADFHDGSFSIEDPTSVSSLLLDYQKPYSNNSWNAVSPKIGLTYRLPSQWSSYVSAGSGFRPPILDDMCRNGNVTKGLKLANPALSPEAMYNFEWGQTWTPFTNLSFQTAVYYSLGYDFQYFVGTGDSIFSGNTPKPVLRRENVGEVVVAGFEAKVIWHPAKSVEIRAAYAFNDPRITSFNLGSYTGKDLEGKMLMEVSPHIVASSASWENKWLNLYLSWNYNDVQWADDENTVKNPSYSLLDVKVWRDINRQWTVALGIQNLLNSEYQDNKGNLGLPRYFSFSLVYSINR